MGTPQSVSLSDYVRHVALADANQDGRPDVLWASPTSHHIGVLPSLGASGLGSPIVLPVLGEPWWVAAADLNHDGHLDLIAADITFPYVPLFLGHGDGTFEPRRDIPSGRLVRTPFAGALEAGPHDIAVRGGLRPGVYAYEWRSGGRRMSGRFVVVR